MRGQRSDPVQVTLRGHEVSVRDRVHQQGDGGADKLLQGPHHVIAQRVLELGGRCGEVSQLLTLSVPGVLVIVIRGNVHVVKTRHEAGEGTQGLSPTLGGVPIPVSEAGVNV